ncbi:hypothetical protein IFM89_004861 [Coptis chinensis]|uniref:Fe2OG dioxygenase domain-containing protein n=1 Tax=Coptis chinensis TaxID=261450 RepID=A0A835IA61_9MAGN|nr:hypothetical protein IFM89_004861 [Coptis chinensis]
MECKASHRLPIINFTGEELRPGTSSWCLVRKDVRQALENYGCFEAVCDRNSADLQTVFFGALKNLFDLPTETKLKNTFDEPFRGYTGSSPLVPLYESMAINDALVLERLENFTNLMWPDGNPSFCKNVYSFIRQISSMEQMVKRMVCESFNVEQYNDTLEESTYYLLRVMNYRAPRMNETNVGLFPHTDRTFITVLSQNQVNGLEIQAKDGDWIGVTPGASSFVVMIGDAFMAWSNGRLYCPPHRVRMNGGNTRYSMGLFSFSKCIVQTPEELVDEEHPLLVKPFDHMGLRHFVNTREGPKDESVIKAYCGV